MYLLSGFPIVWRQLRTPDLSNGEAWNLTRGLSHISTMLADGTFNTTAFIISIAVDLPALHDIVSSVSPVDLPAVLRIGDEQNPFAATDV